VIHDRQADRGRVIGAYAIARSLRFPTACHYMPLVEIMGIAKRSETFDKEWSTWKDPQHRLWMIRKTTIVAIAKRLPLELTRESLSLASAAHLQEQTDIGRIAFVDDGRLVIEGQAFPAEQAEPAAHDDLSTRLDERAQVAT
jgi:hypothetical protein